MKLCGVYVLEHRASGRLYVGKSTDVARRIRAHFTDALARRRHCPCLAAAIVKYSEAAFDARLVEPCASLDEAAVRERYWIAAFGSQAPRGFNLTPGGDGFDSDVARATVQRTNARRTPGYRRRVARLGGLASAAKPESERRAIAQRRADAMDPLKRSLAAYQANAAKTPEERRAIALARAAKETPAQRRERALKAWVTRRGRASG